jgi:tRNA threonylcarbamoyladenosine biosynthesis protein TsaB
MALILSIESSGDLGSVAIHQSGKLIREIELEESRQHASNLAPAIESLIQQAKIELQNIDAVAVSKGPGSYTGLRIGASLAKGISYALSKKIIGVDTLDVIAYNAKKYALKDDLLCPMIDARRMEVYCKLLDNDFNEQFPTTAVIVEGLLFADFLKQKRVLFFGNGVEKCKKYLNNHTNVLFAENIMQDANALGQLAYKKFINNQFEDVSGFEPFYLKEFFIRNPHN